LVGNRKTYMFLYKPCFITCLGLVPGLIQPPCIVGIQTWQRHNYSIITALMNTSASVLLLYDDVNNWVLGCRDKIWAVHKSPWHCYLFWSFQISLEKTWKSKSIQNSCGICGSLHFFLSIFPDCKSTHCNNFQYWYISNPCSVQNC